MLWFAQAAAAVGGEGLGRLGREQGLILATRNTTRKAGTRQHRILNGPCLLTTGGRHPSPETGVREGAGLR